jgi:hypothetical protein
MEAICSSFSVTRSLSASSASWRALSRSPASDA